jgi:dCMP deaminase
MRPDWDEYFLGIAQAVSARGECRRSRVGAVLVHDRRITSTGYNGVLAGQPSCLDGICPRERMGAARGTPYDEAPCVAIHAEANAADDAFRRGLPVRGGTMYLTKEPCEVCHGLLRDWGVLRVVWRDVTTGREGTIGFGQELPLHRTEAGWPRCSTCDGGGCPDCTDPAH